MWNFCVSANTLPVLDRWVCRNKYHFDNFTVVCHTSKAYPKCSIQDGSSDLLKCSAGRTK